MIRGVWDTSDKNRGFGFVQFENEADAAAALDNMDGKEWGL